ncbi:hypothetical protein [Natrononativus amylolyticus]|uniref:hypothetical protein n=1 Tax=Natrononativus amylolyticus TaxID=2963434 RepID=UPI0020CF94D1|nr:hypothetical protein [Natrononativus amylolyticus]
MAVTLGEEVLGQYQRFSLYNSPYPAHDAGCAIDLYPGTLRNGRTTAAPSPVAGTVLETKTVRAPPKPYAPENDHLILLECASPASVEGLVARVLHVEPTVSAGDRVEIGDSLGRLVRAGFFAPWVDNHLHVGFRRPAQNPHRASGSLPLEVGVEVRGLEWSGRGTVVATGETYAVLDEPRHPSPGSDFVGIRADGAGVLDGGLPHYDDGGLHGGCDGVVRLNGDALGAANGRTISWDEVAVTANGEVITGLSFFCARDADFGAKLIHPGHDLRVGDAVSVRVGPLERADEPADR